MARELEAAVVALAERVLAATRGVTPAWLVRPGRAECAARWRLVKEIYRELTGLELRDEMPPRERREVDAVLRVAGHQPRIVEVDERQHFNRYRATTVRLYPDDLPLAFDPGTWIERSEQKGRLEGGGFAKPRPPLFPGEGGRHRQRAFRDALCDILPPEHGWLPTLRIAHFEVEGWIWRPDARLRMEELLSQKLDSASPSEFIR